MKQVVVLISGHGSNLEAILKSKIIFKKCNICLVISNNTKARGLDIAREHNIETLSYPFNKDIDTRKGYDTNLADKILSYNIDLIVLAGWMHVLSNDFLKCFPNIINLHPALPGQFPGHKAIEDAYNAFQNKKINKTGVMVHRVVEEIDAGEVIGSVEVPLFSTDEYKDVEARVKFLEKPLLISSIIKVLDNISPTYVGKVRNVTDVGFDILQIDHSDRLSAFDKYVCDIEGKGLILNLMSKFWFEKTRHIIPNHMLYAEDNVMIAKKCIPFKIEVIVRSFITGSLWNKYITGCRNYCGNELPEDLCKYQKLSFPIVTPTTKGKVDEPISPKEIINRKIMTQYEWNYVREKSLELFKFGSDYALEKDLILVDTKYEFGKDKDDNIILIDEIHTCDSSRFWLDDLTINEEPKNFDKDIIRNYYKEHGCNIPQKIKTLVKDAYYSFYKILTNQKNDPKKIKNKNYLQHYFENIHNELVIIMSGSTKDNNFVKKIKNELILNNIYSLAVVASAHKNTYKVLSIIKKYQYKKNLKLIWVTVAGRSNALSGVVSANSKYPVIACPPFRDKMDMLVNINSTIQCPSNVPVMTILEPSNVAIAIKKILNL